MAFTTTYFTYRSGSVLIPSAYYLCDIVGDLPAGVDGDLAYVKSTDLFYTYNGAAWASVAPNALAALLASANVFTQDQEISTIHPSLIFNETDQGADLKRWSIFVDGQALQFLVLNDNGSIANYGPVVYRTGILGQVNGIRLDVYPWITFGNLPSPSTDPKILDQYEEGTWTPTDASGAGLAFGFASGTYTKIGRLVFIEAQINYPATGSGAAAKIGGLPFTPLGINQGLYYSDFTSGGVALPLAKIAAGVIAFTAPISGAAITNIQLTTSVHVLNGVYVAAS